MGPRKENTKQKQKKKVQPVSNKRKQSWFKKKNGNYVALWKWRKNGKNHQWTLKCVCCCIRSHFVILLLVFICTSKQLPFPSIYVCISTYFNIFYWRIFNLLRATFYLFRFWQRDKRERGRQIWAQQQQIIIVANAHLWR